MPVREQENPTGCVHVFAAELLDGGAGRGAGVCRGGVCEYHVVVCTPPPASDDDAPREYDDACGDDDADKCCF